MSRSVNRNARHFNRKSIILLVTLACLAISSVATLAINRGAFLGRTVKTQERQPVVANVPLPATLVPAGLPVVLSNSMATIEDTGSSKSQLVTSIIFQVKALNAETLTNLNLMVLEFDEKGLLYRVDGFLKKLDLSESKLESVTLPINRRVRIGQRLTLAVERADGAARGWEADLNDLARGVATIVAGNPTASISARNDSPISPDYGAALCSNGMRRADSLARGSDKTSITSYTCNQQDRSFTITFNGKKLI